MNQKPIRIRVSKSFAIFFIPFMLVGSGWVLVTGLTSDNEWWVKAAEVILALFFVVLGLFGLYFLLTKRFEFIPNNHYSATTDPKIIVTDEGVTCIYQSKQKTERINWNDVDQVQVLTTDEGPAVCDVFIVLHNTLSNSGVVLPQDREETDLVFKKLQRWPGFDNENFIKAMGSAKNEWFLVWKKGL